MDVLSVKKRVRHTREQVAFHEAGHAVVARRLGIPVDFIAMFRLDESATAGAQTPSAGYATNDRAGHEADAKVALAGRAAQWRAFPGSVDSGGTDDVRARSEAIRIAHIMAGLPVPTQAGTISISQEIMDSANAVLKRLQEETSASSRNAGQRLNAWRMP